MEKIGVAVFVSGKGSNAEKLMLRFAHHPDIEIRCLVTNNEQSEVVEKAKSTQIPVELFENYEFENPDRLLQTIRAHRIDWIVLAGFLRKIAPAVIQAFPDRILNIHPALLPDFGGKGMYGKYVHQAVVASGKSETGITIHFVDEEFDHGKVVAQHRVSVTENDDAESVAQKVQELEHRYFSEIVERTILTER